MTNAGRFYHGGPLVEDVAHGVGNPTYVWLLSCTRPKTDIARHLCGHGMDAHKFTTRLAATTYLLCLQSVQHVSQVGSLFCSVISGGL